MKVIRNDNLARLIYKDQGQHGPWAAADEYGRLLISGSFSSSPVTVSSASVATDTAVSTTSELAAAAAGRKSMSIYNTDTSETAYINIGSAATTADIPIRPGEWWHMSDYGVVFTEAINVIRGGSSDITLVVVSG